MKPIRLFFLLPVLFITACINVEDFGPYWDQGVIDPVLEGYWDVDGGECTGYLLQGDHYKVFDEDGEARTLTAGGSTYLMNQDANSKLMFKYAASQDKLVIFSPKSEKKQDFIKAYPSENFVFYEHTMTVKMLDEPTLKVMSEVGDNPEYWEEETVLSRRSTPCPLED